MAVEFAVEFEESLTSRVGRGRNVGGATIPAKRFVSHTTDASYEDAIDTCANVSSTARLAGVTAHAIEAGRVGDVHSEGVRPVESTGAEILVGHRCAVEQSTGRVYSVVTTAPSTGDNVMTVGVAKTKVASGSAAGTVVMLEIHFDSVQG